MANKKLDKLLSRSKELAEELKAFLISNKMGLDPEFYDMALLVKQIMDSGVKPDEIREMVGIDVSAENTDDKKEPEKHDRNDRLCPAMIQQGIDKDQQHDYIEGRLDRMGIDRKFH